MLRLPSPPTDVFCLFQMYAAASYFMIYRSKIIIEKVYLLCKDQSQTRRHDFEKFLNFFRKPIDIIYIYISDCRKSPLRKVDFFVFMW